MSFTLYLGPTARARLLDFLGDHPTMDYTITELAAKAGLSRPTVYAEIPALLRLGLVRQTRRLGSSRLFRIDLQDPVVRGVLSADLHARRPRNGTRGRRAKPTAARR